MYRLNLEIKESRDERKRRAVRPSPVSSPLFHISAQLGRFSRTQAIVQPYPQDRFFISFIDWRFSSQRTTHVLFHRDATEHRLGLKSIALVYELRYIFLTKKTLYSIFIANATCCFVYTHKGYKQNILYIIYLYIYIYIIDYFLIINIININHIYWLMKKWV